MKCTIGEGFASKEIEALKAENKKAKEIIREVAESHNYFDILEAYKKAEAFLKERENA